MNIKQFTGFLRPVMISISTDVKILSYLYLDSNNKRRQYEHILMFLKDKTKQADYKNKLLVVVQNNSLQLFPTPNLFWVNFWAMMFKS